MNVALLAQLMGAPTQQTNVVGTMWVMTGEAVLLDGRMFPKQRPALLSVTFITDVVGRSSEEHLAALSSVRIMTGGAVHL